MERIGNVEMTKYGSVCSGIEAATVAWHPLGWHAEWFAEIEAFPATVLRHHYPHVPNFGDMTILPQLVRARLCAAPDVLVGGTPCQAFSVAGLRNSLADHRGQLTLSYVELADAIDDVRIEDGEEPVVIVWENVPGVLNTKDNAFGCFLAALAGEDCEFQPPGGKWKDAGCVFGPKRAIAWRVLDAQFFGLAQRRRRVFVVASARKGFDPAAILFEFDGVRRDTPPSRETGEGFTSRAGESTYECGGIGQYSSSSSSSPLRRTGADLGPGCEALVMSHGQANAEISVGFAPTLNCNHEQPIAFTARDYGADATVSTSQDQQIHHAMQVRRLTPRECERLQGFPDDYTLVPVRGKPAADGPRYKALGNSMAVPCMNWIGRRLLPWL